VRNRAAARHALDGFYGCRDCFRIGLRPVKAARETLKKLFDLLALDGLVVLSLSAGHSLGHSLELWIGRIRMVCAHGNLIADIVGEFAR
jgi:hypothetical protein